MYGKMEQEILLEVKMAGEKLGETCYFNIKQLVKNILILMEVNAKLVIKKLRLTMHIAINVHMKKDFVRCVEIK